MGAEKRTVTTAPKPPAQSPVAPMTPTGEGPFTVKSLPSAAIELQSILFGKNIFTASGEQPGRQYYQQIWVEVEACCTEKKPVHPRE